MSQAGVAARECCIGYFIQYKRLYFSATADQLLPGTAARMRLSAESLACNTG